MFLKGESPKLEVMLSKKGKVFFYISCVTDYGTYYKIKKNQLKELCKKREYYCFSRGSPYLDTSTMHVDVYENRVRLLILQHDGETVTCERVIVVNRKKFFDLADKVYKKLKENK